MLSIIKTPVIICLLLLVSCISEKEKRKQTWNAIYNEKGLNTMPDMLFPEMIDNHVYICGQKPLLEKNRFACIAGTEFSFGTLTEDLRIDISPIKKGYANDAIGGLDADEKGDIMWAKMGYCGFLAIDTRDNDTVSFVPSVCRANRVELNRAYTTGLPGKILLFVVLGDLGYMLYDFANKKDFYIPDDTTCANLSQTLQLSDKSYLLQTGKYSDSAIWHIGDLTTKGFANIRDNDLTKALTKVRFHIDIFQKKCFHNSNRMLIGTMIVGKESPINAVAHWDEKYEHISIEPLFLQCPSEYEFSTQNWTFSLDGKWLVNSARKILPTIGYDDPEMVFYHVDPKYPQGISPPVFAGKTYRAWDLTGVFIDHSKAGVVYLDLQTGHNGSLMYKMNDMMPIIARKLKKF